MSPCLRCGSAAANSSARFCATCGAALPVDLNGRLIGPYRVLGPLGQGGMGQVFRALHIRLGRIVALKLVLVDVARDASAVERFRREALVLASLHHPNIVSVFDLGDFEGLPYIAMEYVEGLTLRQVLEKSGALPRARALGILQQVLAGLQESHRAGVVHRDLKPANVLVRVLADGADHVQLVDFGIAKRVLPGEALSEGGLTQMGSVVGTPGYMAPEQIIGEPVDHRIDLYAAGVLLYEMLAGQRLYGRLNEAQRMRAHLESSPPAFGAPFLDVDAFLRRALAKTPEERFASAADMRASLPSSAMRAAVQPPVLAPISLATPRPPAARGPQPVLAAATPQVALALEASLMARWLRAPGEREAVAEELRRLIDKAISMGDLSPLLRETADAAALVRSPAAKQYEVMARQELGLKLAGLAALIEERGVQGQPELERLLGFLGAETLRLLAFLGPQVTQEARQQVAALALRHGGLPGAMAAAERLPPAAVAALIRASDANPDSQTARPLLVLAVNHPSADCRRAGVFALSIRQARLVDAELRKRLADRDVATRVAAATVLGAMRNDAAVPALITSALNASSQQAERLASIEALGCIGGPQAARVLRELLAGEKDVDLRCAVVVALGRVGDRESLEAVRREGGRLLAPRAVKEACQRALSVRPTC